jgi:hypothetical protein
MRSPIKVVTIVVRVIVTGSIPVNEGRYTAAADPLPAAIGHVQPRASAPSNSQAEQAVQDRLSAFDAQRTGRDELLDKKPTICRYC